MQLYFHGTLREIVGGRVVEVPFEPGQKLDQLLAAAVDKYPALRAKLFLDDGSLPKTILIAVNGRNVRLLEELETPIPADARINIFPFFRTTSVGKMRENSLRINGNF